VGNPGFGLTETSPTTHMEPRGTVHKTGSIGILLSNLEARIVINETEDAMEGEPGELWLRGPGVMKVRPIVHGSLRLSYDQAGIFEQPRSHQACYDRGWLAQNRRHCDTGLRRFA